MSRIIKLVLTLLILPAVSVSFSYSAWSAPWQPEEEFTDWVALPGSKSLCRGYYDPLIPNQPLTKESLNLPMTISADQTSFSFEGESSLTGNVLLQQGERSLRADQVIILRSNATQEWDRLVADGHIQFLAPGMNILGNRAEYFHTSRQFAIDGTAYHWYPRHARGQASHIEIDNNTDIHLTDADYTTCAPDYDTWRLSAKSLTLHPQTGRAVAKHIRFDLHEIPIFYFPYFDYPIDNKRHSGFLFPAYGSTSNSGYEISVPYYWNIAPNLDFMLTERWLSERGSETQTKFRYLFPHSEGVFQWHFLPNDRKYAEFKSDTLNHLPSDFYFLSPQVLGLETGNNRSAVNFHHVSQWNRRVELNVTYDYVSDDNYFVDLGNDINTASIIYLPQQANLSYYGDFWTHYVNVEEYQVLQPFTKPINEEIYKRQPEWVFQATYPHQFLNLTYGLNGEMVNFAHKPALVTQEPVTVGQRYHLRPSISLPLSNSWYFFTPRAQADWLMYGLELGSDVASTTLPTHPSRTIPIVDVDTGLIFERPGHFGRFSFIQTLEPRLYYLNVPYVNQNNYPNFDSGVITFSYSQLFRDNRFSGRDRIGDANQVTASLTSRFLPTSGGQEILRASIGQIFYFESRRVALCEQLGFQSNCYLYEDTSANSATSDHSNMIAQAEVHASPTWSSYLLWEWDSMRQETEQAAFTLQYQPQNNKIINLNYYWLKDDLQQTDFLTGTTGSLHQADISVFWPLSLHWEFISRWQYDLQYRENVEILGGLEYNGCCISLQLIGSRYRMGTNLVTPQSYANAFFAQIVFKGLSALGLNNPDGKLRQKVPGYTPLADRQRWIAQPAKDGLFPPKEIPLY